MIKNRICECGKKILSRAHRCPTCARKNNAEKVRVKRVHTMPTDTAKGITGALAELRVSADLIERGMHVFRAIAPHCPCDLIAFRKGTSLLRIQVKTGSLYTGKRTNPTTQVVHHDYDVLATVYPDGISYTKSPNAQEWPF